MRAALTLRRDVVWTRRVRRMVGVSTAAHVMLFATTALLGAWMAARRPAPMVAYSVDLTDMPGTGGQLPAGPGKGIIGRSPAAPVAAARAPAPAPAAPAPKAPEAPPVVAAPPKLPEPAPAPTPKVEAPPANPPTPPPVAAKKVEAKPIKVEAKVEPKPKKVEAKPAPPKVEAKKPEPKPEPKPVAKAEPAKEPPKPAEPAKPAAEPASQQAAATPPAKPATAPSRPAPAASKAAGATDDYAAAAERFRGQMAAVGSGAGAPGAGVAGGGPGGGVLGEGGDGRGGGQIRSLEYIAYLQRVRNAVQERWASAISQPGLVAAVRFQIAPDGTVSDVRLEQSSGNAVYDQTAVAAVQRVGRLPPPPAAYVNDFRDFQVNFRGSEIGGMGG